MKLLLLALLALGASCKRADPASAKAFLDEIAAWEKAVCDCAKKPSAKEAFACKQAVKGSPNPSLPAGHTDPVAYENTLPAEDRTRIKAMRGLGFECTKLVLERYNAGT